MAVARAQKLKGADFAAVPSLLTPKSQENRIALSHNTNDSFIDFLLAFLGTSL